MTDERSTTSPNAVRALTWTYLVELEPQLDALLSEAVVAGFLCRDEWDVEREWEWNAFKNRLADLVGFHSRHRRHPVLGSYEAYRLAYTTLNDVLAGDPPMDDCTDRLNQQAAPSRRRCSLFHFWKPRNHLQKPNDLVPSAPRTSEPRCPTFFVIPASSA